MDMSASQDPITTQEPAPMNHRKVSIVEGFHGHDNLGFDSPRSRKVSANSDHAELGPVRKKSILHNKDQNQIVHQENGSLSGESGKHANGDLRVKKHSATESVYSKTRFSDIDDGNDKSWWYDFCVKCRSEENHPSWQPPLWPKLCPYPFCPTYRQFTRFITIILIGTLTWCVLYAIFKETVAPGGKAFQLIVLSICAYFGGYLFSLTTLPALIGMLFTGILFQNVGFVDLNEDFKHISEELRRLALTIILIRAGLDLDPNALKRLKWTVLKLGLVPWAIEAGIGAVLAHFLLDIRWDYAILLAPIIAAVSPAVVVPCLFRLRAKGYGVAKGIPTLIIAVAGIDDAASVAIFGIVKSIVFSNDSLTSQILQGPISIVGGIGFGILWGVLSNYAPERHDPFVVPLRVILLLMGGLVSVFGSDLIGYGGAGPLACVAAAFVSIFFWTRQGWDIEENPAATAYEIFWMVLEPVLFGITGTEVKFDELDGSVVWISIGIILLGVVIRIFATAVVGIGSKLNLKEKLFVSFAWMSKATVQAALGSIALGLVHNHASEEYKYAEKIAMICIMSIILTAPLGALLITITGPLLLTKTKFPEVTEGWRRSHRPSIRDISIIDEEEERDVSNVEASSITTVSPKDINRHEV